MNSLQPVVVVDRPLKFDEKRLLEEGILLKILHDLQELNKTLEIGIAKVLVVNGKEWEKSVLSTGTK